MDEMKKFIRYVLPGLVFCLYLATALFFTDHDRLINLIQGCQKDGASILISGFLISGALGYVFSFFYHIFSEWNSKWKNFQWFIPHLDHADVIQKLMEDKRLEIRVGSPKSQSDTIFAPKDITIIRAWDIITYYWYGKNEFDEKLTQRTQQLSDTTRGLGTTLAGTCFAFLLWMYLHYGRWIFANIIYVVTLIFVIIAVIKHTKSDKKPETKNTTESLKKTNKWHNTICVVIAIFVVICFAILWICLHYRPWICNIIYIMTWISVIRIHQRSYHNALMHLQVLVNTAFANNIYGKYTPGFPVSIRMFDDKQ